VVLYRKEKEVSGKKKDNELLNVGAALVLAAVVIGLLYYFGVFGK
jgi:hypothetical protein